MDPLTPLDTLCRIILRAREFEAQIPGEYDPEESADNVDDDDEGALSVLEDDINTGVEEELRQVLDDLGDDQLAEVLAFCWVGQGTYDASEWNDAMEEAADSGRDAAVAAKYAGQFPQINLVTIDKDFGGWAAAQKTFFDDGGLFDQVTTKK